MMCIAMLARLSHLVVAVAVAAAIAANGAASIAAALDCERVGKTSAELPACCKFVPDGRVLPQGAGCCHRVELREQAPAQPEASKHLLAPVTLRISVVEWLSLKPLLASRLRPAFAAMPRPPPNQPLLEATVLLI